MFSDYYAVLGVTENATSEELKSAFKNQAMKWHPDRNRGVDTTKRMQEINEAYLILKDSEARNRYDKEYQLFKQYQKQQERPRQDNNKKPFEEPFEYSGYKISDDTLNDWMKSAKAQAVDLAKQTIEDLKGMTSAGLKAAGNVIVSRLITGIIIFLIFTLVKSCSG